MQKLGELNPESRFLASLEKSGHLALLGLCSYVAMTGELGRAAPLRHSVSATQPRPAPTGGPDPGPGHFPGGLAALPTLPSPAFTHQRHTHLGLEDTGSSAWEEENAAGEWDTPQEGVLRGAMGMRILHRFKYPESTFC